MIARFVLHLEWHRGYRPRISLRRAPRVGDVVWEGMQPSVLEPCRECSTVGFLARELTLSPPSEVPRG